MADTRIIKCVCVHPYQDERYGRGKRLANQCDPTGQGGWRCTVCGRVVAKGESQRPITDYDYASGR